MTATRWVTLTARDDRHATEVTVDLDAGCRLRSITATLGDESVELLAAVPPDADPTSSGWGSYPMAPWAGRLRHGRCTIGGDEIRLGRNHRDGSGSGGGPIRPPLPPSTIGELPARELRDHAIHGTVFARPWTVEHLADDELVASCDLVDLDDPLALAWPFDGRVRQRIRVSPTAVTVELSVTPADRAFPVVVGWHPWFAKPQAIDAHLDAMYEQDDIGLPTGRLVPPPPGPWDDCFVSSEPATLHYDRAVAPQVTVTSDCDHLVIYDELAHASCVEPQSGPPDAVNLGGASAELATPDSPVRRTMTISW